MNPIQSALFRVACPAILLAQLSMFSTIAYANDSSNVNTVDTQHKTSFFENVFARNTAFDQTVPNYYPQTYCTPDIEAKTQHPQHQNILRHDIDCMLTALKPYQQLDTNSVLPEDKNIPYFAYKAQAWLAYAYSENSEKSLTKAGAYALSEGLNILQKLQQNRSDELSLNSDIPPTSAVMRPDLWANLMSLKQHGATVISPRNLAFGEVQLIWAAAEYCELGWRHSNEHFKAAQKWTDRAQQDFIENSTEETILNFEQDYISMFQLFESLDTGDKQCLENKVTSFSVQ